MKKLAILVLWLALAPLFFGQAALSPTPKLQFLDNNGTPLAGCLIYTYEGGTTTPVATYTDSTESTPNANPVVCDSGGFASIWLVPGSYYKFVVQNSGGVTQYTVDNIRVGISSAPFVTNNPNPALSGILRLANTDTICWRNAANTNDICMSVGASDQFIFDSGLDVTGNSTFNGDVTVTGNLNTTSVINSSGSGSNSLISGGGIFCASTGLTCTVAATKVSIGGQIYSAPQTDVTLAAADPTNPRIDVFYIDTTPQISDLTGTPAASPVEPSVDPTTQWNLGFINIAAGETDISPTNITLYDEDTGTPGEWDCTTSGAGWNCSDTTHPFSGTKDIQSTGTDASSYVKLTAASATDLSSYGVFKMEMRTESAWTGQNEVWVTFYNGSTPVGNTVFNASSSYGWNGSTTSSYQIVIIPMTAFNLGSNTVDNVRIKWNTGGSTATNKTIYLDSIQLQDNGIVGTSGGAGTVSSVAMTGDGTVFKSVVPGSPVTSSGTLAPTLASAPSGNVLAGPIASLGSNVGVRQFVHCTFHTAVNADSNKSFSCPAFSSPLQSGDNLLVIAPGNNNDSTAAFTDTQGNTLTLKTTGGSNPHNAAIAFGTVGTSGADIVSGTGIHYWDNGGSWSQYDFWVYELTGASAINLAYVNEAVGGSNPYSLTQAISPGASTDALIRLSIIGSNNVGSPSTGSISMSPTGSSISSFTSADVNMGYGTTNIYTPGSTASSSNVATFNETAGTAPIYYLVLADIVQSASAGSAPWVARRLTEGDLPASSISAIQSVNVYNLASNFALSAGVDNTVFSESLTMPSDGCPCRVLAQYGLFLKAGSSAMPWDVWMSDGTNVFNGWEMETTDATKPSANSSAMSPVSYTNNQAVTFTVHVQMDAGATSTYVYRDATAGGAKSFMTLSVMQSRN